MLYSLVVAKLFVITLRVRTSNSALVSCGKRTLRKHSQTYIVHAMVIKCRNLVSESKRGAPSCFFEQFLFDVDSRMQ